MLNNLKSNFINFFKDFFKKVPEWEYGTLWGRKARRHLKNRNVQFILGKMTNHDIQDSWIDFDRSWWKEFKVDHPDSTKKIMSEDAVNEK